MRSATKEERESVNKYIESISTKTGITFAPKGVSISEKIIDERISLLDEEHEGDAVVVVRLVLQDLADEIKALKGEKK